jgi:hypothetical protein
MENTYFFSFFTSSSNWTLTILRVSGFLGFLSSIDSSNLCTVWRIKILRLNDNVKLMSKEPKKPDKESIKIIKKSDDEKKK